MNIFVVNGSPKAGSSNTFQITTVFLDGLNNGQCNQVHSADISKSDIGHCLGCYACWTKTPGKCVINDDMAELAEKYINADLVIWSFPLYYFGMPSKTKVFLDRLLPTNLPAMSVYDDGTNGHPSRYDLSKQWRRCIILIFTQKTLFWKCTSLTWTRPISFYLAKKNAL